MTSSQFRLIKSSCVGGEFVGFSFMMDKQNKKEAYVNEFPEPLGFCPKNLPFARKNGCPSVGGSLPSASWLVRLWTYRFATAITALCDTNARVFAIKLCRSAVKINYLHLEL